MANSTWSATDQINTGLDAPKLAATSSSGTAAVRATDSFTTGKYYWEYTVNVAVQNDTGVGIASAGASLSSLGASASNAVIIYHGFPVWVNGAAYVPTTSIGTITAGSLIGVACDFAAKLIWFRLGATGAWNASSGTANDPATGVGGVSFAGIVGPFLPAASMWQTGDKITANFGASAFTGTVPTGFTSGMLYAPPDPAFTTWDPNDQLNIQLSSYNLFAHPIGFGGVRSADDAGPAAKLYWEVTFTAAGNTANTGIALRTADLATTVSTGKNAIVIANDGRVAIDGVQTTVIGAFAAGGICCIAIDMVAQRLWVRNGATGVWNGSGTANPATGVGGHPFGAFGGPAMSIRAFFGATTSSASNALANFGASAFSGTVPSGFTAGFPSGSSTDSNNLVTQVGAEHWYDTAAPSAITQVALEQWLSSFPARGEATQVSLEQWFSTAPVGWVTQVALEQWASVLGAPLRPGFIPSSEVVFPPTLRPGALILRPGFIPSGEVVFPPTLRPGVAVIHPGFIPSTTVLFPPSLALAGVLLPRFIPSSEIVYTPTLIPGLVTVHPGLIPSSEIVFPPLLRSIAAVAAKLALDNLQVEEVSGTPGLTYRWRSRQFYLPRPASLGACQISLGRTVSVPLPPSAPPLDNEDPLAQLPPGVNALFRLYVGPKGQYLYFTKVLDEPRTIFRLPSGLKAFNWQFEIVARVPVHSVELASTMRELKTV